MSDRPVDRERIKREIRHAQATRWPEGDSWIRGYAEDCAALLDALEAAERERDEARRDLATPTPMYVTGLLDEREFMRQLPPHDVSVFGPFFSIEQAQAHARTLSTDPDEAVVVEVASPGAGRPLGRNRVVAAEARVVQLEAQLAEALPTEEEATALANLNAAVDRRSEYWPGYRVVANFLERTRLLAAAVSVADSGPAPEPILAGLSPKVMEAIVEMSGEMAPPLYPDDPLVKEQRENMRCECGYPDKPCLRVILRNGPPFPRRPCEPMQRRAVSGPEPRGPEEKKP